MSMLDVLIGMCLQWFSGGKSTHKDKRMADWMPSDWQPDPQPKKQGSFAKQFDAFVKANSR